MTQWYLIIEDELRKFLLENSIEKLLNAIDISEN